MKVFVDTNILLDLSSLSLVNVVYISKKYGYIDSRERLADITEFV